MLVIAHRLSTITGCDGVAVFDKQGNVQLCMGKAAVLEYIQSHQDEMDVLPTDWDQSLVPLLDELTEKLAALGLDDAQLELATQQLAKRMAVSAGCTVAPE